jgi:NitT/TauT family transport system ATP-binding protein
MAIAPAVAPPGVLPGKHPPDVVLDQVVKRFPRPDGGDYVVLAGIDLRVDGGTFCSIVGPSGCGKTSILRLVAGLTRADGGRVLVAGQAVTRVNPRVGFVFQQDALLPWRPVHDNVALGLRLRGTPKDEVKERVHHWLRVVGLAGFERHYPAQLSGGMRKRVAIAQTLICEPEIILMDEPFTHLDAQARLFMEEDLLDLFVDGKRTILFVTHDLDEAIALSDVVVVMSAGPASTIRARQRIEFRRPRDLLGVRRDPGFGELSAALWRQLHEEVARVYGRAARDRVRSDQQV